MICKIYELNELQQYEFVVVFSKYHGTILLSKHKKRTTWETQGGHIEEGETPLEAARRELYEESGAEDFDILPENLTYPEITPALFAKAGSFFYRKEGLHDLDALEDRM